MANEIKARVFRCLALLTKCRCAFEAAPGGRAGRQRQFDERRESRAQVRARYRSLDRRTPETWTPQEDRHPGSGFAFQRDRIIDPTAIEKREEVADLAV